MLSLCPCLTPLCSGQQLLSCCRHLQRDGRNLEHCSSQRSSTLSCSDISAEPRGRCFRWWPRYVLWFTCLFDWLLHHSTCRLVRGMHEWEECGVLSLCPCLTPLCSGGNQWQCHIQSSRHLQRDGRNLEHCSSQRSSTRSCSDISAEPRSRCLRWWQQ